MSWEFRANNREELAVVHQALPARAQPTVAGELLQMTWLLEALANMDLLKYPLYVNHIGTTSVPDFQLESPGRSIGVEMAKVTMQNLERARGLQQRLADPPTHFQESDICYPEAFALKLKRMGDHWSRFVVVRLPYEGRAWLDGWNGREKVPDEIKALFVTCLNAIVDGPPIAGDAELVGAWPKPEILEIEDFPCEETPRDRKSWLEDAFVESVAQPINRTLSVSPFIRRGDGKMKTPEVVTRAFLSPQMEDFGPTISEEREIWLELVQAQIREKSPRLAGRSGDYRKEEWLVLWDLLGTPEEELSERAKMFSNHLAPQWRPGWFSRIIIQDHHFEWQLMFTENGFEALP